MKDDECKVMTGTKLKFNKNCWIKFLNHYVFNKCIQLSSSAVVQV